MVRGTGAKDGKMNEGKLYYTTQRLKTQQQRGVVRLGDTLTELMNNQISPMQARFALLADIFSQLLPVELARHCTLSDVSGGQVKVLVDSPVYLYELKLCGCELLEELQRLCPRVKIKKIKFVVGN